VKQQQYFLTATWVTGIRHRSLISVEWNLK
jgi:hypothetical protein